MACLIVQPCEHREVTELRWNGASELIRGELAERATNEAMRTIDDAKYSQIVTMMSNQMLYKQIMSNLR